MGSSLPQLSPPGLCPASNCIGVTVDVYTLETHLNEFEKICGDDAPIFELSGGNPSGGVFSGVGVENGFFNPKTAKLIKNTFGKAKIITATNVFAHMSTLGDVMNSICLLLKEDGYFVFENENGDRFKSNVKGTWEETAEMLKNKKKLVGKEATIKYFNRTPAGIPRFGYVINIDRNSYE